MLEDRKHRSIPYRDTMKSSSMMGEYLEKYKHQTDAVDRTGEEPHISRQIRYPHIPSATWPWMDIEKSLNVAFSLLILLMVKSLPLLVVKCTHPHQLETF